MCIATPLDRNFSITRRKRVRTCVQQRHLRTRIRDADSQCIRQRARREKNISMCVLYTMIKMNERQIVAVLILLYLFWRRHRRNKRRPHRFWVSSIFQRRIQQGEYQSPPGDAFK